jgi:serine phosphatase RsbU (regulator of sigma subunit)
MKFDPIACLKTRSVWRLILAVSAGSLAVWVLNLLMGENGSVSLLILSVLSLFTWVLTIRLLLLDSWLKIFWILWLTGGICLLVFLRDTIGIVLALSFSFIFLLFRRYKPYQSLSSRRKAALFLLALLMFFLLSLGFVSIGETAPESGEARSLVSVLFSYTRSSLVLFWFFSLVYIFFRIRLHFMKLNPKLAISAFMLVVVPLLLGLIMGLFTLYATLGESRAIRAASILEDWAVQAAQDRDFIPTISPHSVIFTSQNIIRQTGDPMPEFDEFVAAAKKQNFSFADWDMGSSGAYFWKDNELWLFVIQGAGTENVELRGCKIDSSVLDRLARLVHSDVRLAFSNPLTIQQHGSVFIASTPEDLQSPAMDLFGRYRTEDKREVSNSIWKKNIYFGMTHVSLFVFKEKSFTWTNTLLLLESSIGSIFEELASERNPLSQAVLVILVVMGVILLILEIFALFFGLRITSGITSAVKKLHAGTRQISSGDLDARIEIPNEDELGDLAAAFNEMAAAVKAGREEAIARERLESELKIARKIQEKLLPHEMPDVPGFEITGTSLPSQQVGGDYFDFLDMGEGKLGIAIGDVSGKGIPAALLMSNLQASLHAQQARSGDVAEVVSRINDLLVRSTDANMFATFFYGILDREKLRFTSTNAGHNPPLLFRHSGDIERLESNGLLIGFMAKQIYSQHTVTLKPGDVLVLFTDGITEAVDIGLTNVADNLFGEERLIQVIKLHLSDSARSIQSAILKAIANFTGNSLQSDDITLVVIKYREA